MGTLEGDRLLKKAWRRAPARAAVGRAREVEGIVVGGIGKEEGRMERSGQWSRH